MLYDSLLVSKLCIKIWSIIVKHTNFLFVLPMCRQHDDVNWPTRKRTREEDEEWAKNSVIHVFYSKEIKSRLVYFFLLILFHGGWCYYNANHLGRPLDWTRMRTDDELIHAMQSFCWNTQIRLIIEPGHETFVYCEHITLKPDVFLISSNGPFETVVAKWEATCKQLV